MKKSCCGTTCDECKQYKTDCAGCIETQGKPAWAMETEDKQCPFFQCCVLERKLDCCEKCADMPCEKYKLT